VHKLPTGLAYIPVIIPFRSSNGKLEVVGKYKQGKSLLLGAI